MVEREPSMFRFAHCRLFREWALADMAQVQGSDFQLMLDWMTSFEHCSLVLQSFRYTNAMAARSKDRP